METIRRANRRLTSPCQKSRYPHLSKEEIDNALLLDLVHRA